MLELTLTECTVTLFCSPLPPLPLPAPLPPLPSPSSPPLPSPPLCLTAADPFQDTGDSGGSSSVQQGAIHIRIQQRNGRKTLTTVQGIAEAYDMKRIAKACKKVCVHAHLNYCICSNYRSSLG